MRKYIKYSRTFMKKIDGQSQLVEYTESWSSGYWRYQYEKNKLYLKVKLGLHK